MTDVLKTCAVVIFRVKESCITSVDGIILWLLIWLVNYIGMLLVVCQLSRDFIGYEDSINWRDTTHFDSEDDYCTGCQNVSHCQQQQSYSGLHSPGPSNSTYFWNNIYDNNRSNWPFLDVVRMEVYNEWKYIIYIIDCWYDQSGIFQRTWESQTLQSIP